MAGLVVVVALFFAFTNGFQDSSATVATMVASRAASPKAGVLYSSAFGFLGAMLGGSAVAFTVEGLVHVSSDELFINILFAAVLSAASWNIITWWFGLPSSSTHALIGGLIGGGIAGAGLGSISWGFDELLAGQLTGLTKVLIFLLASVGIGFAGGFVIKSASTIALRNAKRSVNRSIKRSQYITTAILAFSHGANDAQKQMGIIVVALLSAGVVTTQEIPLWVRFLCATAIALGTIGGGWKIMKTLGRRISSDKADRQFGLPADLIGYDPALHRGRGAHLLDPGRRFQHYGGGCRGEGQDGAMVGGKAHGHLMVADNSGFGGALSGRVLYSPGRIELLRWMHMNGGKGERKGWGFGSIFPPNYDFHAMLFAQADKTRGGVRALSDWLKTNDLRVPPEELQRIEQEADDMRHDMEKLLLNAFSTPFDRQDIYSISRQMDYILNFCLSTAIEMRAFGVHPDKATIGMTTSLQQGVEKVKEAIGIMAKDPAKADAMIRDIRRSEREIEVLYVASIAAVFDTDTPIDAMKKREVYHHLKDAGRTLSITIDILHRIIVELA